MTTQPLSPAFTPLLLDWYRLNARDLPWRHTREPYPIWISEIMLQQTRVAAVLGYYARFLDALPTVDALASAPEEQLLKLWEGLGYYSRARNLQKAARMIVERGSFPNTYEDLLSLPGVGEYTASAVGAAAFGLRQAAVDGNVLRVVTRLTNCHEDISLPHTKRIIRSQLQQVMPEQEADVRIFSQATMELGATVCVPNGAPKCDVCPVSGLCLGRGTAEALPVKKPKRQRRTEEKTVLLLLRQGHVALRKRDHQGLLAGLWEFPNVDGILTENAVHALLTDWGLQVRNWKSRLTAKHIFTHVEWHMTGYTVEVTGDAAGDAPLIWVDNVERYAVPSAFARFYGEAQTQLKEGRP